jgi:hypothetical protein
MLTKDDMEFAKKHMREWIERQDSPGEWDGYEDGISAGIAAGVKAHFKA